MIVEKLILNMKDESKKPIIIFTSKAYAELVSMHKTNYSKSLEFMYIGEVLKNENNYIIKHFNIIPQCKNSGAYCETDDDKYAIWLQQTYDIKDRDKIRLHGHSHVNMATSPSGTDDSNVLNMMSFVDDYFIQLISNNKLVTTINLYDKQSMLIYKNLELLILLENGVLIDNKGKIIAGLKESVNDYKPKYTDKKIIFDTGIYYEWKTKKLIIEDSYMTVYVNESVANTKDMSKEYQKDLEEKAETIKVYNQPGFAYLNNRGYNYFDDIEIDTKPQTRKKVK